MNEHPSNGLSSTFDDGDVYDLMDNDNAYGLDFYVALSRKANGPVLDVASGRILLPCLQAGVDIEGLELFEPMLETLRAKAAARATPGLMIRRSGRAIRVLVELRH